MNAPEKRYAFLVEIVCFRVRRGVAGFDALTLDSPFDRSLFDGSDELRGGRRRRRPPPGFMSYGETSP